MSIGLLRQATDLRYTGFYLPVLALVYLQNEAASGLSLLWWIVPEFSNPGFYLYLIVSLLGATINHGIYRSIYGQGGPRENPKDKWTVRYQRLAMLFWKSPNIRPSSLSEFDDRITAGIEVATKSWLSLIIVGSRAVVLTSIFFFYSAISLVVFIVLLQTVLSGPIDYLGFGLLTAQALFLFGSFVWGRFTPVISEDSAPWIFVPEHQKASALYDDDEIEFYRDPRGLMKDFIESINEDVEEAVLPPERSTEIDETSESRSS